MTCVWRQIPRPQIIKISSTITYSKLLLIPLWSDELNPPVMKNQYLCPQPALIAISHWQSRWHNIIAINQISITLLSPQQHSLEQEHFPRYWPFVGMTGEFPTQRPVTRSFDSFFDRRLNKRFSEQSWSCWFETPSRSLWRHCNVQKPRCFHARPIVCFGHVAIDACIACHRSLYSTMISYIYKIVHLRQCWIMQIV